MHTTKPPKAYSIAELWARPLVSEKEAATMLGLPLSTWQLVKRRNPPPMVYLGKHNRILTSDLLAWLESQRGIEPRPPKRRLYRVGAG